MHSDTIAALSSGALPSGVAVVRVSGTDAFDAVRRLCDGALPPERRASLRTLKDRAGAVIDQAIVVIFTGPNTVTGEDIAEFHLHGGRAVVTACLAAITEKVGTRLAEAGEFTRRAFENGRIDLTEAEGLADLIAAETEGQHKAAILQASGALRTIYDGWMRRLTEARARLEASFDFSDEGDVGEDVADALVANVAAIVAEIRDHLGRADRGEILRSGFKVAIVGAPNAGKSSLLNALADREVAIVTEVPGTTRDVIEATLDLGGLPVRFSDTAGIRETSDTVEAIGVERARGVMAKADLVLALVDTQHGHGPLARFTDLLSHVKHPMMLAADASLEDLAESTAKGRRRILTVRTKADRPAPSGLAARFGNEWSDFRFDFSISAKTGEGLDALTARIAKLAAAAAGIDGTGGGDAIPLRDRQRALLQETLAILQEFVGRASLPPEIGAETLRRASDTLGRLTGRVDVEDLLDVIFSEFCIGK
ncbi:tRNA uridine-5-carboxymethylaminomethyl(34) synthesis GTPase MnmE [Jiella sp. MQZ9-1]|uniref:tRNA modification GTPase MnmE n=1 Tax=Jiella flava TaxID=2816857 RepID=A0A939JVK0_9HYPH|nr:tRNA uridine-5-carboxymethylaminomethyl(34) synthesis GTPase MnmE [Jiella flava]MBO0664295.1 tRNA uridine-5-carboxymethylaminomethyl(34) synthesis GTPase MnmE [Jiella flava]MCD2472782.1 tRNA uridine-5-carboxymethylaminomethyl(34) synthesis GTPase MnmE [Jiella flava]